MFLARRVSDGQTVAAYDEFKRNGPFRCLQCNEEVILKSGRSKVNHFAHANPLACDRALNESEQHRTCKLEIYRALQNQPGVTDLALERPFEHFRPDIYAAIRGTPVAIEIQISSISVEAIRARTIAYHQKGIYVLWILIWKPELDRVRYTPTVWEKWIHALYFGRVFYWLHGLEVAEYRFNPALKFVPKKTWIGQDGKLRKAGGYVERSVRFRTPLKRATLHLLSDFGPAQRLWWEGGGVKVPDAKLFVKIRRN